MVEKFFTPEQVAQISRAFEILFNDLRVWFDGVSKVMEKLFPHVSQTRRAEVKRVRTAYRRKKGKRW